jgi:hypothetical protein
MRYFCLIALLGISLSSCKQCVECKYSTLKGTEIERYCSSTKEDREAFEQRMEEEAANANSQAICTKERY